MPASNAARTLCSLGVSLMMMMTEIARAVAAQPLTQDPGAWLPMAYADLQRPSAQAATYADIWKDAVDSNNRAYAAAGDRRFETGNAPATEAHFVVWSTRRSVVLSVLDTAPGCAVKQVGDHARATVKLCPTRIAIYEGIQVRTMDAGRSCFLELAPGVRPDPAASVAYASYDVATRTLKAGMILDHRAVEGCSFDIPLYPQ